MGSWERKRQQEKEKPNPKFHLWQSSQDLYILCPRLQIQSAPWSCRGKCSLCSSYKSVFFQLKEGQSSRQVCSSPLRNTLFLGNLLSAGTLSHLWDWIGTFSICTSVASRWKKLISGFKSHLYISLIPLIIQMLTKLSSLLTASQVLQLPRKVGGMQDFNSLYCSLLQRAGTSLVSFLLPRPKLLNTVRASCVQQKNWTHFSTSCQGSWMMKSDFSSVSHTLH